MHCKKHTTRFDRCVRDVLISVNPDCSFYVAVYREEFVFFCSIVQNSGVILVEIHLKNPIIGAIMQNV